MIRALSSFLALMLAMPSSSQTTQVSGFVSPCPDVFMYEPTTSEPNKWYGVVNLNTETPLYALWLNIVLDNKANILGNWVGEVTTDNNIDFKIENTKLTISPDQPLSIRFFIQYKAGDVPPKLKAIRFNGKEICEDEKPELIVLPAREVINYDDVTPEVISSTTVRPTVSTSSKNYNQQQTTLKNQYWYQTEKPQTTTSSPYWTQPTPEPPTTTTLKPQYWPQAKTTESTSRTTLNPQYWQSTTATLKPIYWTQAKTEVKPQTTVRTPVWAVVKVDNQQVTSTVRPTNQSLSQTRNTLPNTTTVKNPVQVWSYTQTTDRNRTQNSQAQSQLQNNQQTTSENKYQIQNDIQPTENTPVWPNLKVSDSEKNSSKGPNNSQTEVKQIGVTKYWSKIPAENVTGAVVKVTSSAEITPYGWSGNQQGVPDNGLQNQPYAKVSIKQAESTRIVDLATDTPLYVRPEDRPTISGGKNDEKNNVDNRPLTYNAIGSHNNHPPRPADTYKQTTDQRQQNKQEVRPVTVQGGNTVQKQSWSGEKTSSLSGNDQTWTEPTRNRMEIHPVVGSSRYPVHDGGIKPVDESRLSVDKFQYTTEQAIPAPNKIDEYSTEKQDDYYSGGLPVIYIPNHGPQSVVEPTCGKVLLNKVNGKHLKSSSTLEGQWPWQIALYQQQTSVDFRYICGGTLVSKRHVITAAHCVTRKGSTRVVNKNTLTVYLGKHNLRNSVEGVQVKFVNKIILYPEYDAMNFKTDLAILELRETVTFSDWVQPICLWPEHETDLINVVGKTGSIVGWGYELTGVAREELSLLKMAVVDQETCLKSFAEFFVKYTSDKTYCAGYRDSGTACNGDSGGGMVFQKGDTWYLRGVVSLSVARQGTYRCDPNHYVIFTDVAKFLPWIQDNIEDYM